MLNTELWYVASFSDELDEVLRGLRTELPLSIDTYMRAVDLAKRVDRFREVSDIMAQRFIDRLEELISSPDVSPYFHQYLGDAIRQTQDYLHAMLDFRPSFAYREMDHFLRRIFNPVLMEEPVDAVRIVRGWVGHYRHGDYG